MAKDKSSKLTKIDLMGYYEGSEGAVLKRIPQEPGRRDVAFWSENGGVDEFRQVGWISLNTSEVWGLHERGPKDVPDMTPLFINVRGS